MSAPGKFGVFMRPEWSTEWHDSGVRGDTEIAAAMAWEDRIPPVQRNGLRVEVREVDAQPALRPLPDPDDVNPAHRATVARWKAGDFAPDKLREQAESKRQADVLEVLRLVASYYDAPPPQVESVEKHRDGVRSSLSRNLAAVVEALLEVVRDGSVELTRERLGASRLDELSRIKTGLDELVRTQPSMGATYVPRDGNIVQLPDDAQVPPGAVRGVGTSPQEPRIPEPAVGHVDQVRFFDPPAAETDGSEDPEVVDSWHLPPGDAAAGRHVVAIDDGPPTATVIPPLDHAATLQRKSAMANERGGVIAFLVGALDRARRSVSLAEAVGVAARARDCFEIWRDKAWTPAPIRDPADWDEASCATIGRARGAAEMSPRGEVVEWMTINPDAEPVPPGCPVALLGDRLGFRTIDGALHVADGRTAVKLGEAGRARLLRELSGDGVFLTGPEAAAYRAFQAASAALEDSHRVFRDRQREHLEATAVLGRATTRANGQAGGEP